MKFVVFRTNLPREGFLRPKKQKKNAWEIWLKKLEFESSLPIETAKVWRKWVIEYWKRIKCCLNYWKKQSGSFSSIALEKHKCQQDFSLDFVSDIRSSIKCYLFYICVHMPSQSVFYHIWICVLPKRIKYRLGIFKGVWKMSQSVYSVSQSVDFHLSLCNLCNLCNLWICVLLPP